MEGLLHYGLDNTVSLHLTDKGYDNFAEKFPNFNDTISLKALKHLTGSYYYMGTYSINSVLSVVEHTYLSHSNPGEWGKKVKRRFSMIGDTLVIQPVEEANAGLKLKWLRYTRN